MKFIDHFPNTVFQTFKDNPEAQGYAKVFEEYNHEEFKKLNKQGCGIYFTPNGFKGGRKLENLTNINAVFADLDIAKESENLSDETKTERKSTILKALLSDRMVPNFVLNTKNGVQPIWLLEGAEIDDKARQNWTWLIKGIIEWSKQYGCMGDEVKDLTRVLRLPNYNHMKGDPFMVTVQEYSQDKYPIDYMREAFPYTEPVKQVQPPTQYKKHGLSLEIDRLDFPELVIRAFGAVGRTASFDKQRRLILDGRLTGGHLGKINGGDFLASSSHEAFIGNRITAPAAILQVSNKEARSWIIEEYNLREKRAARAVELIESTPVKEITKPFVPYTWGTPGLDSKIWALKRHQFCVIAGETGGGKSAYAFFVAMKNAQRGHNVLFVNLEMFEREMKERIASDYAGITIEEDRTETYPPNKQALFDEKMEELNGIENLEIISIPRKSPKTIEVIFELVSHRKNIDLVIIDNLDKIQASDDISTSFARTEHITDALISFTNEEQIPVLLLHHYNQKTGGGQRAVESLRGSTKIGHDSDVVMFLSREMDEDVSPIDKARLVIKVKKIRRKGTFCIGELFFDRGTFRDEFIDRTPKYVPHWEDRN